VALGEVPKERPGVDQRLAAYHLARIGNNLNQLGRWSAWAMPSIHAEILATLAVVRAAALRQR
jgi:hypothetical protein